MLVLHSETWQTCSYACWSAQILSVDWVRCRPRDPMGQQKHCLKWHTHHKMFRKVMHDQNILQLTMYGLHILYKVWRASMTVFALSSIWANGNILIAVVWNMQSQTVTYMVMRLLNSVSCQQQLCKWQTWHCMFCVLLRGIASSSYGNTQSVQFEWGGAYKSVPWLWTIADCCNASKIDLQRILHR